MPTPAQLKTSMQIREIVDDLQQKITLGALQGLLITLDGSQRNHVCGMQHYPVLRLVITEAQNGN